MGLLEHQFLCVADNNWSILVYFPSPLTNTLSSMWRLRYESNKYSKYPPTGFFKSKSLPLYQRLPFNLGARFKVASIIAAGCLRSLLLMESGGKGFAFWGGCPLCSFNKDMWNTGWIFKVEGNYLISHLPIVLCYLKCSIIMLRKFACNVAVLYKSSSFIEDILCRSTFF